MINNVKRGRNNMKLKVEELDFNAHNFDEENFEEFDDIYDAVMRDEMEVDEKDIIKLCKIFNTPFEEIHPHQYIKIQRITFYVIKKVGEEKGFENLIEGLTEIPKQYVDEYIKMLKNSYSQKDILLFENILKKHPQKNMHYIIEILEE